MIARNAVADVNVISLIGERGRELRDFIEKDLGPEGLKRSRPSRFDIRSSLSSPSERRLCWDSYR